MLRGTNRTMVLLAAAAVACSALLGACGGDDTTTVDPPTTVDNTIAASSSTIVTSDEGMDAIVQTWVKLGFSEAQARCLVEKTDEMSSQLKSTGPGAVTPGDQNLIEQMMTDCGIDDASLKGKLGG